jgi:hypothetical protein
MNSGFCWSVGLTRSPEQFCPLVGVEVACCDRSLADAAQRAGGNDVPDAVTEAARDEAVVSSARGWHHEGLIAPSVDENTRVDRRWRMKREARQAARERRLEERSPDDAAHAVRPRHSALERHPPLDNEIGPGELRRRIVEQQVQQIRGPVKRQVRDHAEGLARQRDGGGVGFDHLDVRPAVAEPARETRVELDGNDALGDPRKLACQLASASAEIDDDVICAHPGVADELLRDTATKKMLATRRARARTVYAPACHGRRRSTSAYRTF